MIKTTKVITDPGRKYISKTMALTSMGDKHGH
jgi:hypothetical protein